MYCNLNTYAGLPRYARLSCASWRPCRCWSVLRPCSSFSSSSLLVSFHCQVVASLLVTHHTPLCDCAGHRWHKLHAHRAGGLGWAASLAAKLLPTAAPLNQHLSAHEITISLYCCVVDPTTHTHTRTLRLQLLLLRSLATPSITAAQTQRRGQWSRTLLMWQMSLAVVPGLAHQSSAIAG